MLSFSICTRYRVTTTMNGIVAILLRSDATGSLAEAQLLTSLSPQGIVSSKSYYGTNLTLAHMGPLFIVGH